MLPGVLRMNRRKFLGLLSTVPIVAVVVPEITRTIFLPPRGGWPVDYDAVGRRYTRYLAESLVETQQRFVSGLDWWIQFEIESRKAVEEMTRYKAIERHQENIVILA